MTELDIVKEVVAQFDKKIRQLSHKATLGDNQAAKDVMSMMTRKNIYIREQGYCLDENNEIIIRTPEWEAEQLANEAPIMKLAKLARGGDENAAKEIVHLIAKGIE